MIFEPYSLTVYEPAKPLTLWAANDHNKRTAFSWLHFFRYVKQTFEKFSMVISVPCAQGIVVPSFVLQELPNLHF